MTLRQRLFFMTMLFGIILTMYIAVFAFIVSDKNTINFINQTILK
jgi:hypothetical protein